MFSPRCVYMSHTKITCIWNYRCSQKLSFTHQQPFKIRANHREVYLSCRHVALLSVRWQPRTEFYACREKTATPKNCQIRFRFDSTEHKTLCLASNFYWLFHIIELHVCRVYCNIGLFLCVGHFISVASLSYWTFHFTGLYVIKFLVLRIWGDTRWPKDRNK